MNNFDKILNKCVCKDALRKELQQPCKRNKNVFATNGELICRTESSLVENEYQEIKEFPKIVEKLFHDTLIKGKESYGRFMIDDALAVLRKFEKHDVFKMISCPKCHGEGCSKCNYDGEIKTNKIIGKAFQPNANIRIGKNLYSAKYVEWLTEFAKLQNETEIVMIAQPEEEEKMGTLFKIGKVEILLMPMNSEYIDCSHEIGLRPYLIDGCDK